MATVDPEGFLVDQFPRKYWSLIPMTLRTAYAAAKALARSEPILSIESAQDNQGRIISWAVDLAFVRLIQSGALPFDFRWQPFDLPTGKYLEIRLPHSVVTISQIADPNRQPRSVGFRENGRLNNEPFFDLPEFEEEQKVTGLPHLLLTHGHQDLTFAHLAVPHPTNSRKYRYKTVNLLSLPHEVQAEGPPPEDTDVDFDGVDLLKQDIEKFLKDHDQ